MAGIGGWGSWGTEGSNNPQPTNTPTQTPPTPMGGTAPPTSGSGGSNSGGLGPGNFGQPMLPWDMPYQGQFTAPMSGYEQNALGGYNNFVQGGMGLNPAGGYLNNELSGQYLNLNSNPYLQQIQQGMQGMKNYNDQQALANIGSSMALGGNALSGARLGAESDYLRNSNNQFQSTMGQLMNQDYQNERGLMNQAPGQLANLANTAGSGYAQLFGMGALPRSLQQNDLNSQYQDFLRQTGNMQTGFYQPDQQIMQMLYGGGYHGQYQPQYGSSTADQLAGLLGGNSGLGSDLGSLLGGLFSGGGDNTITTSSPGTDGVRLGYDGPNTAPVGGPANYFDKNWYTAALLNEQAQRAQASQNQANGPNTTAPAILALLASVLGGSGGRRSASGGGGGMGVGGGGQGSLNKLIDSIFGGNQQVAYPNPPGGAPTAASIYDTPIGPGEPGMPGSIPMGGSLSDYLGYLPPVDPSGGLNNLPGGYGGDLTIPQPTDFGGGGGGGQDFGGGGGESFD